MTFIRRGMWRGWLCSAVALGSLAGCGGPEAPTGEIASEAAPATTQEQPLYVASSTIWSAGNINVCWENPSSTNATERQWVQQAVQRTWKTWSSNISFTGWGTCSFFSGGIRISISDEQPHTTGLGTDIDGSWNGMVLNFTFQNWSQSCQGSRQYCIETIAVHEFGHALGFAHEQNRPDTPSTCTDAPQGSNGDVMVGAWDLNSVMNYCNPNWNGNGNLSPTDIQGLQRFYGHPLGAHFRTGDYNGDGRTDWSWYAPWLNRFVVMLSNGNGTYSEVQTDTSGWGNWSTGSFFSTGDYNGDGRTDWSWYAPWSNNFIVMLSNGVGGFTIVNNDTSGWGNWSGGSFFRTGDYNGDGRTDWSWYAPWSNTFVVMLSNGVGGYSIVNTNTSGWGNWSSGSFFRTGDYNGDGRTDWSWYAPWSNNFTVMLSNGVGGYSIVNNNTSGWGNWSGGSFFSTGDFNGDGRTDWSWYAPWSNGFIVMFSNGAGGYSPTQVNTSGWGNWSSGSYFSTGDYSGDRRTDWSWYAPWSNTFTTMLSNGVGGYTIVNNNTAAWGNWSDKP